MKINHNMSAVITNAQLLHSENGIAETMERLSSGLKINHSKDDPAGMAISDKMQAQIDGLAKASQNASNGNSLLQIADTAIGEITDILQRMRELSVQAANDTNMLEDREAMQEEIAELRKEVDRISRDTEYNTKTLLDGSSDTRVYTKSDFKDPIEITRMSVTEAVNPGIYKMKISKAATQATQKIETKDPADIAPAGEDPVTKGTVTVNGYEIRFTGEESEQEFFEKLRDGAAKGNVNVFVVDAGATQDLDKYPETGGYAPKMVPVQATNEDGTPKFETEADGVTLKEDANGNPIPVYEQETDENGNPVTGADGKPVYKQQYQNFEFKESLAFVCNEFGYASDVVIQCSTPQLAQILSVTQEVDADGNLVYEQDADGNDKLDKDGNPIPVYKMATTEKGESIEITKLPSAFGPQSTVVADGNRIRVTDVAGFSMDFMVGAGQTGEFEIEVTDIGPMTLQIGANEHQTMEVCIPKISSAILYLDEVDVTKVGGGDDALMTLDDAISKVGSVRSRIGAYENRLDYAIESLDASGEDMTAAFSRIKDADMAEEMTEYTKYNVLAQAGTSVLAQANDIPQMVLQLLQ